MSPDVNPFSDTAVTDSKQKIDFEEYEELQSQFDQEKEKTKSLEEELEKLQT